VIEKSKRYVAYLRVSTDKQGRSGLGLEAQRETIATYLRGTGGEAIAEFVEVESGKLNARPQLTAAMYRAKVTGAKLLIAKLDRLSRNVAFIAALQESGVKFVCADMPEANELTVHLLAAMAQHERKMISERTKAALAAAKRRGTKLGNPNGARALKGHGNDRAIQVIKFNAKRFAEERAPIIADIRAGGITSLKGIARELNARGILTARRGRWYATGVKALLDRLARSLPSSRN
jgi:DNA invertase Pin-like site-specific DNA recombinase